MIPINNLPNCNRGSIKAAKTHGRMFRRAGEAAQKGWQRDMSTALRPKIGFYELIKKKERKRGYYGISAERNRDIVGEGLSSLRKR